MEGRNRRHLKKAIFCAPSKHPPVDTPHPHYLHQHYDSSLELALSEEVGLPVQPLEVSGRTNQCFPFTNSQPSLGKPSTLQLKPAPRTHNLIFMTKAILHREAGLLKLTDTQNHCAWLGGSLLLLSSNSRSQEDVCRATTARIC